MSRAPRPMSNATAVCRKSCMGILTGGAARTVTVGVIGANIGAGLVILFTLARLIALVMSIRSTQRPHD